MKAGLGARCPCSTWRSAAPAAGGSASGCIRATCCAAGGRHPSAYVWHRCTGERPNLPVCQWHPVPMRWVACQSQLVGVRCPMQTACTAPTHTLAAPYVARHQGPPPTPPPKQQTFPPSLAAGQVATQVLAERVGREPVECEVRDVDRYGRSVAVCSQGGEDLNGFMVARGWAVAFRWAGAGAGRCGVAGVLCCAVPWIVCYAGTWWCCGERLQVR